MGSGREFSIAHIGVALLFVLSPVICKAGCHSNVYFNCNFQPPEEEWELKGIFVLFSNHASINEKCVLGIQALLPDAYGFMKRLETYSM